jgi:tetratricopeptide (TPR) repeat protein
MGENVELALERYREALETCPDDPMVLMALWQLYRRHDLPGEEKAKFRKMLVERLENPDKTIPAGSLIHLARNPDADPEEQAMTLRAVTTRLAVHPDDRRLLEVAGELHYKLGQPDEARQICGRLLKLEPTNERRWQCLLLEQEADRWEEAFRLVEAMLAHGDTSPYARMTYIDLLGRLGRHDEMLAALDELVPPTEENEPLSRGLKHAVLLKIGWDLYDDGRDPEAETMFRRALEILPHSESTRKIVVHLYGTEDEREALARQQEQAAANEDPLELFNEGTHLLASGDARGAFERLSRAAPKLKKDFVAWFNLGLAAIKLERWEEAAAALDRAAALSPDRVDCQFNRGIALSHVGRCEESIEAMRKVLELAPETYQAHYYLYSCYKNLGDVAAAQRELKLYNDAAGQ